MSLKAKSKKKEKALAGQSGYTSYADYLSGSLETLSFASKGDRTRYRLKIAAARALEEMGYTDLKVADVCANANVALGTFYVYYKDKNEIAIEVVIADITDAVAIHVTSGVGVPRAEIAGVALAVTPVSAAVNRLNLPEPWMLLFLVGANDEAYRVNGVCNRLAVAQRIARPQILAR